MDPDTPIDFVRFFAVPLLVYFVWLVIYFAINFWLSAKKISERNYDNMYNYYSRKPWAQGMMTSFGIRPTLMFCVIHFTFFFCCHLCSLLVWYSQLWHGICIVFWLTVSIWNSSCFYMDYFSKKYEASLQAMEQVE
jgi:hypothetical protein